MSKLAINGAKPLKDIESNPWPKWPIWGDEEKKQLIEVLDSGLWSYNGPKEQQFNKAFAEFIGSEYAISAANGTVTLQLALEACGIGWGDEVIVPSYTFVSSALAFVRQGARIVFADTHATIPNIDETKLENLITKKTKAIVVVHYAGFACEMDTIMKIAKKYNLIVIEDAAQAIDSYYKDQPLGSIGHLATFSFHETKNIQCGEGGLLVINDQQFMDRAKVLWEKGTNRVDFFDGKVNKYEWVDLGSSFLPSELNAAFLFAQLEQLEIIQKKRVNLWNHYFNQLEKLARLNYFKIPQFPAHSTNNGHSFFLICKQETERDELIQFLKEKGILAIFHYQSLHNSPFYTKKHDGRILANSNRFSKTLIRLPLFIELSKEEINYITDAIHDFFYEP